MKAMQCEKCGGHINHSTLRCEYCGTQYEDNGMGTLYITRFDPKMDVLCSNVSFDWAFISSEEDLKTVSEYAIKEVSSKIAESIIPYLNIESREDPLSRRTIVEARLRVIRPDQRYDNGRICNGF